jgi:hypothetical protein
MRVRLEGDAENLSGFMYFWGKHITGFDNMKHCSRCLQGSYEKSIAKDIPLNRCFDIPFNGKAFYICGVAKPYNWANNFHAALIPGNDTVVKKTYNGITVVIEGAKEFKFNGDNASVKYPHYGKEYTTCRNFQFGVSFFES